jgi:hypothetical protein
MQSTGRHAGKPVLPFHHAESTGHQGGQTGCSTSQPIAPSTHRCTIIFIPRPAPPPVTADTCPPVVASRHIPSDFRLLTAKMYVLMDAHRSRG